MNSTLRWIVAIAGSIVLLIIFGIWKILDKEIETSIIVAGIRGGLLGGGIFFLYQWAKNNPTMNNTNSDNDASEQVGAIWNPNAASNWSLIFSPAFGSYLHALNWRTLGEPEKEKSAMGWFYVSLAMLCVYVFMGLFTENPEKADGAARGLGLLYLLVWYFLAGRAQARYVKEKFGSTFPRRSWGKPLLIGMGAIVGYVMLAGAVGFMVGSTTGVERSVPATQRQQTTPATQPWGVNEKSVSAASASPHPSGSFTYEEAIGQQSEKKIEQTPAVSSAAVNWSDFTPVPKPSSAPPVLSAQEVHMQRIYAVHPDANEIYMSAEFARWLTRTPKFKHVTASGTTQEVIDMFSAYKRRLKAENQRFDQSIERRNNAAAEAQVRQSVCKYKAVMTDNDYFVCGVNPPSHSQN